MCDLIFHTHHFFLRSRRNSHNNRNYNRQAAAPVVSLTWTVVFSADFSQHLLDSAAAAAGGPGGAPRPAVGSAASSRNVSLFDRGGIVDSTGEQGKYKS